ncbi:hypothetical protein FB567DRAFT_598792 [Paraphoma chrysanthemicola]|uniref:Uncharacterized protein n=1 Tax=Paraphoma chrysanthemicola TaxID=798071 RepID=A0A8K0VSQ9_9PLEO|nr:hypothetical protein FB567DRAFT_598792 [Paraphoma chrysanthemicola]
MSGFAHQPNGTANHSNMEGAMASSSINVTEWIEDLTNTDSKATDDESEIVWIKTVKKGPTHHGRSPLQRKDEEMDEPTLEQRIVRPSTLAAGRRMQQPTSKATKRREAETAKAKLSPTPQTQLSRREKLMGRRLRREEHMREADAAEDTLETLRAHQTNPAKLAAFDRAVQDTLQRLEAEDSRSKEKPKRKARTRLLRALQIVTRRSRGCAGRCPYEFPLTKTAFSAALPLSRQVLPSTYEDKTLRSPVSAPVFPNKGQAHSANLSLRGSPKHDTKIRQSSAMIKQEPQPKLTVGSAILKDLHQNQALIWDQHEATMYEHFAACGVPLIVRSTKLAIQKKGFQIQAENELQVAHAKRITESHASIGTRACNTDFGGTIVDVEFPKDAIWELSSTQLWKFYEGGQSWNQLGWIPGGYLRIKETRAATRHHGASGDVILEFGSRSFTAEGISIPRFTDSRPINAHVKDHAVGDTFPVRLIFLQGGHLHVIFPAVPLVQADPSCNAIGAVGKEIEFSGALMGSVD